MKNILIGAMMLFLCGCATVQPNLIVTKPVVLQPPAALVACPLDKLPKKFKSDGSVAKFMLRTYDHNMTCKTHMDGLKKYYEDAQDTVK